MNVEVDANQLTDKAFDISVDVVVTGEGVEIRPHDNKNTQELQLMAEASLQLLG